MSEKSYIFIVQVTRQLCVDIVNEFALKNGNVTLLTGEISNTTTIPNPAVRVVLLSRYNKTSSVKRMLTWSYFTIQVFFYLLFHKKSGKLVFITTPPFTPFLGPFFKLIFGQKYDLVIWDLYPDALLSIKSLTKKNLIYRAWGRMNYFLLKHASSTITLGKYMSDAIVKYSHDKVRPVIIHNWADTGVILPKLKTDNSFALNYHQENKLTVLYSGNMGETHDFESLLKAAEKLREYHDINFMFIGEGPKKKYVEKTVDALNLGNVIVLPFQENDMFPLSITTGDISVVTLEKGMETVSVPSKTYSALAAGNVLLAIAARNSELALIIDEHKCGSLFEPGDDNGIASYILSLYRNREQLNLLKHNSRNAAAFFTSENAKIYYETISKSC